MFVPGELETGVFTCKSKTQHSWIDIEMWNLIPRKWMSHINPGIDGYQTGHWDYKDEHIVLYVTGMLAF